MSRRPLALAAIAVATLVAAPQWAAGKQAPPSPTPDETGCRDIVSGAANYQQLLATLVSPPFQGEVQGSPDSGTLIGAYKHFETTVLPRGVALVDIELAAPSCTDVTYTLSAYTRDRDPVTNEYRLLGSSSQQGDGLRGTQDNRLRLLVVADDYPLKTVSLRVTTSSSDVVHDTAPDLTEEPHQEQAKNNGLPGGGAVSSFK